MKISLLTTAFSTIITTATASSVMDLIGFNMNRGLADMCIDETTDLFIDSSSELTMAYEEVVDEIADRSSCNAFLSNCLVDFDTFDTTDGFSSACDMEGGKTIKGSAVIDCQYKDGAMPPATPFKVRQAGGNLSGFTLSYYNLVDCVSDTCADDDVVDKISSTLSDTTLMLEEKFNAKCASFMNYLSGGDVIPVSIGGGDSTNNIFTDNAVLPSLPFTDESSASSPEEEVGDSEEGVEDEAVEIKEEGSSTSTSPAVYSRGKMTVAILGAFLTTLVAIV